MFNYLENIIFSIVLFFSLCLFYKNFIKIFRNINMGKPYNIDKNTYIKRFFLVLKTAFGISKLNSSKFFIALLHSLIYFGFIIISVEILEIIIDGIFSTHRFFSFLGDIYNFITYFLELLSITIIVSCILFLLRRTVFKVSRLNSSDLDGFPKKDGIYILILEILIMILFLVKNTFDYQIMSFYGKIHGLFPISSKFHFEISEVNVYLFYKLAWWLHILLILFFLNYLYYSKHLHIITSFYSIYYSNLDKLGKIDNILSITNDIKTFLNINLHSNQIEEKTFGAKDVLDLNKRHLIWAYACTQCGRCSDVCPQTLTGKKLSPRKIMISTRNRLENISKNIDNNKYFVEDKRSLLDDYISREEIWACNTCMACNNICPLNIEPLSIILELRRYIFLEETKAPKNFNDISNNIETNFSPWKV